MMVSMLLAGCSTTKPVTNNDQNKYFPDGTFFTAELFVEFTEEFDDILVPEKGQAYRFCFCIFFAATRLRMYRCFTHHILW